MSLTLFTSPIFADHLTPPGHPERVERFEVMQAVAAEFRKKGLPVEEPRAATEEEIGRVHAAEYIAMIKETAGRAVALDPDTFTSPHTWDAATTAAGAAISAVDHVLDKGSGARASTVGRCQIAFRCPGEAHRWRECDGHSPHEGNEATRLRSGASVITGCIGELSKRCSQPAVAHFATNRVRPSTSRFCRRGWIVENRAPQPGRPKMTLRWLFYPLVMLLCSVRPAASETIEDLARQVRDAESAFADTMAKRDLKAFATYVADEAVFFGRKDALRGKAAVVEEWKAFFKGPTAPFSWTPETVEVLDSGALAHSSGPVYDAQGKRIATFNSIWWRGEDGRWRVVLDKGCDACECAGRQ